MCDESDDLIQFLFSMPYKAVSYFGSTPQFDLCDVVKYGVPDKWKLYDYIVLDNFEESRPFAEDYKFTQDRQKLRPIHHYDPVKRFEYRLKEFMCGSRSINLDIGICNIIKETYNRNPLLVWDSVKSILKKNGYSKYYNRIPSILLYIGYEKKIVFKYYVIDEIINDFRKIVTKFKKEKIENIKYIPNYRFIALKLMEKNGVVFEYKIPLLKLHTKIEKLDKIWDILKTALY